MNGLYFSLGLIALIAITGYIGGRLVFPSVGVDLHKALQNG
ncbi:hypothetical protein FACS189452_09830 [Bacteroidia bacterium]|nr:hypothetical protein FACS189452_09830 [Bacteroidia bacterium]